MRITFHFADDPPTPPRPAAILLRVCAWHTSPADLDTLNRQYPGAVSHGMCPECQTRFEQEGAR
jgi:hypothetical protein